MSDKESRKFILFLGGIGLGIGLAILFAPMSGEEIRKNLTRRASDLADSARDLADQGRERVRNTISATRREAQAERADTHGSGRGEP